MLRESMLFHHRGEEQQEFDVVYAGGQTQRFGRRALGACAALTSTSQIYKSRERKDYLSDHSITV